MTQKEREDRFIEKCRKDFGVLTYEAELLLRYGFSAGADELGYVAYAEGIEAQRARVLGALGAASYQDQERLP
jgi:hypothetical protein